MKLSELTIADLVALHIFYKGELCIYYPTEKTLNEDALIRQEILRRKYQIDFKL